MSPENSKPEWFQMAEEDGFAPKSTRKRAIRIMALATPLLVLGAGIVYAQTQNSSPASATSTASAAAAASPISLSSTPTAAATATTAATPASTTVAVSQARATTAPKAAITIKKPTITKPTGGAEDSGLVRSSDDD